MSYPKLVRMSPDCLSVHMGTIVERRRKDGSVTYTAQIGLKQNGVFIHREARTFDRKQAAYAWLENRAKELNAPGGLAPREDSSEVAQLMRARDRVSADFSNGMNFIALTLHWLFTKFTKFSTSQSDIR